MGSITQTHIPIVQIPEATLIFMIIIYENGHKRLNLSPIDKNIQPIIQMHIKKNVRKRICTLKYSTYNSNIMVPSLINKKEIKVLHFLGSLDYKFLSIVCMKKNIY